MNLEIVSKLRAMRMPGFLNECIRQEELPAMRALCFEERMGMAVDAEFRYRADRREVRLIKSAHLSESTATLGNIDFTANRGLNERFIAEYSSLEWVRKGENIIITGPTGIGKTYLLCAFGREACVRGMSTRYYRATRLLTGLENGRGDGTFEKKLSELVKPDLLILDEFGLQKFDNNLCLDFLEVIEDRYVQKKSLIIGTQLPVSMWPEIFENRTVADAIMDRIVQKATRINLKGPSMRKPTVDPAKVPEEPVN